MHPLETYLRDLSEAHSAGVPETTHYPALRALLNEIGSTLKPKVRCVINPKSKGAGIPDGGLYTPDQLPKGGDPEPPRVVRRVRVNRAARWLTSEGFGFHFGC
ncbi:hypothetical protein [Candidatus Binatus sp.]|uniref:hypothetical protein n=1 Tax=Candidatus Binatus sp. TaxID=2811406 RepID=UPI002B482C5B|nr:hypothetical protein [Candidatus Binatus sp.]